MTGSPAFHPQAFSLLLGLHFDPTIFYYRVHKAELKQYVEQPLQSLMFRAAERLPALMRDRLETRRNLFSRFLKNDFGQGGAWENYWGAFYPKGSRRIMDTQLAVWLDYRRLSISFYISDYAVVPRARFLRNCARYRPLLPGILAPLMQNERVLLALEGDTVLDDSGRLTATRPMTWDEWLDNPAAGDFVARMPFTPQEVTTLPARELEEYAVRAFSDYFPLALLSMEDEPLPLIEAYLSS